MLNRILCILIFLLLLPCTVHADVIFSPQSIRDALVQEKSVMLAEGENQFVALTDLTGYSHPHRAEEVSFHKTGEVLRIRCLYTDEYGVTWARHALYSGPNCTCWVPCEGLAPADSDPMPAAPDSPLPVPRPTRLTRVLQVSALILLALVLTFILIRLLKRRSSAR